MENTVENEKRVVGRIIRVSKAGWGFISSRDIQFTRIFFHWTALCQDTLTFLELHTGMYVEFTPIQVYSKGWRAVRVRVVPKEKVSAIEGLPNDDELEKEIQTASGE